MWINDLQQKRMPLATWKLIAIWLFSLVFIEIFLAQFLFFNFLEHFNKITSGILEKTFEVAIIYTLRNLLLMTFGICIYLINRNILSWATLLSLLGRTLSKFVVFYFIVLVFVLLSFYFTIKIDAAFWPTPIAIIYFVLLICLTSEFYGPTYFLQHKIVFFVLFALSFGPSIIIDMYVIEMFSILKKYFDIDLNCFIYVIDSICPIYMGVLYSVSVSFIADSHQSN